MRQRGAHPGDRLPPVHALINGRFDAAQKERLIEALWRVAYADQVLCKHQEHLLRRLANLLYVRHSIFIATKLRVLK